VDNGVNATALPVGLPDGSRGFGLLFESGANQGYRIDITNGVARGNEAETIYMVTSSTVFNYKCCFDVRGGGGEWRRATLRAPTP